ncbi:MAG: sensor domain-containing diguanylate cyclase [Pseudomonadota bacterium]
MIEPKPYGEEQQRLESLRKIRLLDTPIEERFERLTRMICRVMDVPISLFNLIDDKRQFYKSVQGLHATNAPLTGAFCTHAFQENDMLLIPDAHKDLRFHDNPFVTGALLNVGFYAGCPIHTPDGMPVGTVCAIDTKPRQMTEEQLQALRDIAAMAETELKIAFLENENKELEDELEQANRLAMIDPLTRLWNRGGMEMILNKEWAEARRYKRPITLVMCDIDHFKKLNDAYGHAVGDDVLRTVSKKLLENLRTEDFACRIGGEEFLLILPNCLAEPALEILERIRSGIRGTTLSDTTDIAWPVTLSFGVATVIPDLDTAPGMVIKSADAALYTSKNTGRDRVSIAETEMPALH